MMFKQRIRRGVRLLDRRYPGWHRKVRITRLDLANGEFDVRGKDCGCVLAQVDAVTSEAGTGSYHYARQALEMDYGEAERCAFTATGSDAARTGGFDKAFRVLTDEWKDEIRRLRAADKA